MTARLPRTDARDNRTRILAAARTAFGSAGLDVPVREIARRAEVGPATVYRHFPTKRALVTEAFTDQARVWQSTLARGLADPDPWRGFCSAVETLCALQVRDHGFIEAVKSAYPEALDFGSMRASSLAAAAELIRRAKATGHLRPDVGVNDLILMITAGGGIKADSPAARTAAARRFGTHVISAFQA
ncbi:AcrR family transcriptional regulator [Amycolatopsis lexingtonensis]|uniref:AcrR family transcriptional regulator n=1 Tax=Amycolatopsis lexingtonensis TaxID=218822 RepID=A0ABR9HWL5_9PSEU|nr:helix-turn-helix domain-containing protein [Amycolatopsis lexingtonensis]MBE1495324.1 AcrR family transcriptional regulator [Amycolatopsis lexingtonensis]